MSNTLYTLEEVLQPRSVAILGASRAPHKWGHVAAKATYRGWLPRRNLFNYAIHSRNSRSRYLSQLCVMYQDRLILP